MMTTDSEALSLGPEYVDIGKFPHVKVDLRYAGINNFIGENLYRGRLQSALLHWRGADKFRQAIEVLQRLKPGWSFLIFDALRPRSVQKIMWAHVAGTPQEIYVANPQKGSIHNFGLAIDLTLVDDLGKEVDMGTPFDSFEELAQPKFEERFLNEGKLSKAHIENRKILREAMTQAGFLSIPHEWWHFNALEIAEAKANYPIIE